MTSCRGDITCCHCGEKTHVSEDCQAETKKCTNCGGQHSSSSKECPIWKTQIEINRIKYTQDISFPEAKKIVESSSTSTSYANATKKGEASSTSSKSTSTPTPKVTVSVQTETTWLEAEKPSKYIPQLAPPAKIPHSNNSKEKEVHNPKVPKFQFPLPLKSPKPSTTVKPPKPKQNQKHQHSDRVPKGDRDPVKTSNRFSRLDSDDDPMDEDHDWSRSPTHSPSRHRSSSQDPGGSRLSRLPE